MAKPKDPRPKAETIAAEIRYLIMSGEWKPGRRLPTTSKLMEQHETSNVTIQRALKILKGEELLEGRYGSGVYVRDRAPMEITPVSYMAPSEQGEPYSWITEASKRSQRGGNRILSVKEETPPARVREVLDLDDDGVAVLRFRIGLLDDEPAELVRSWYPVELARGNRLSDRRKIPGGSPTLLTEMGYPTRGQDDVVSTRLATPEEYKLLELPGDVPVLEIFRVVYSDDRRPIEVTELIKPGHIYKMSYTLSAP